MLPLLLRITAAYSVIRYPALKLPEATSQSRAWNLPRDQALPWVATADLGVAFWKSGLILEKLGSPDTWSPSKPLSNLCSPVVAYTTDHLFTTLKKKKKSRNGAMNHDFLNSHKKKKYRDSN